MIVRLLEAIHGHAGVLACIALLHPAWFLRRGKPLRTAVRVSVALTLALTTTAFALGNYIYEDYRATVKRALFLESRTLGFLFETKEHLAFVVFALTLSASIAALIAPKEAATARQWAAAQFLVAGLLCLAVNILGTVIAATKGFPQ